MYCKKCGAKLDDDAVFCSVCGAKNGDNEAVTSEKKPSQRVQVYEGDIHKCPNCGEVLPSDAIKCPSCGYEIRGREAVSSVKEFVEKVNSIDDENKKIEAIKLFAIPNTKEDIMEFMFIAVSNFDVKLYATNKQGENIAGAWRSKIEQCYKKAMLMFDNPADIEKIEKMYKEINVQANTIKRNKLIMTIGGIALIIISILLIGLGTPRNEDGSAQAGPLSYIAIALLAIGIIVLVFGLKKKKTNKQIEDERIAKMNKKNNK